jgi:hypothetical protein
VIIKLQSMVVRLEQLVGWEWDSPWRHNKGLEGTLTLWCGSPALGFFHDVEPDQTPSPHDVEAMLLSVFGEPVALPGPRSTTTGTHHFMPTEMTATDGRVERRDECAATLVGSRGEAQVCGLPQEHPMHGGAFSPIIPRGETKRPVPSELGNQSLFGFAATLYAARYEGYDYHLEDEEPKDKESWVRVARVAIDTLANWEWTRSRPEGTGS